MSLFTFTIPSPSVPTLTVNAATKSLTWTTGSAISATKYLVEIASDSAFTDILFSGVTADTTMVVTDSVFFAFSYYRVTAFDTLGTGGVHAISYNYIPDALPELGSNEVTVVLTPTATGVVTVPTSFSSYTQEYVEVARNMLRINTQLSPN